MSFHILWRQISSPLLLYLEGFAIFLLIISSVVTFCGHFRFIHKFPWIIKCPEFQGIFPNLLILYMALSLLVSCFIVSGNDFDHISAPYSECAISVLRSQSQWSLPRLLVLAALSILLLLESYFSYNRSYSLFLTERLVTSSKLRAFLPFTGWILTFSLLFWTAVSMVPMLMLFVCGIHFAANTVLSYSFYAAVRRSYSQCFEHHERTLHDDAHSQMVQQLRQIRLIFISASLSSLISAAVTCIFAMCGDADSVVFGCVLSSILLHLVCVNLAQVVDKKSQELLYDCDGKKKTEIG